MYTKHHMHCEVHRVNEYSAKWKNNRELFSQLTVSLSVFDVASLFISLFVLEVTKYGLISSS